MEKHRFEDWEVLPLKVMDDLGERLDNDIKEAIKKAVDEMFIQSWAPLYRAGNLQVIEWLKSLTEDAKVVLRDTDDGPVFRCELIPEDYDYEFTISFSAEKVVKEAAEWFSEDEPEVRKRIAESLRKLADAIDG